MKKVICLVAVLAVCLAFMSPVFAAEDNFAPSVGYKDGPGIVDAEMEMGSGGSEGGGSEGGGSEGGGSEGGGSEDGETENVGVCLVLTSLKAAEEQTTNITEEARELLLEVYDKLDSGEMKIPTDEDYVVRDLVDLSWSVYCCENEEHDHEEKLNQHGVTVTISFDLGVSANAEVEVYTYNDEKWEPIHSVKNNGDGTVTCVFEHFCPVAFAVREPTGGSETGDPAGQNLIIWIALMAVSAVAILFIILRHRKRTR